VIEGQMQIQNRIRRGVLLFFFISLGACSRVRHTSSPEKPSRGLDHVSYGTCNPAMESVGGKVSLRLLGNGCLGIDPRATNEINEFLSEFPKTGPRLQQIVDQRDVELAEKVEQIVVWAKKYRELTKSVRDESAEAELNKKAADLLRDGDLERAAEQLDQLMRQGQRGTDQGARLSYYRAQAYELQLLATKAWPL